MKKDTILHESFEIGLLLKGLSALVETISGAFLLLIPLSTINNIIARLIRPEMAENSHDFIYSHLISMAGHFSVSSQLFVALYLLSHGVIKLFIVSSLWKEKLWAYPVGIIFFIIFILYQIYRYSLTHSGWLIVLTIFDLLVIYLTWMEYQRIKAPANIEAA